MSQPLHLTRAQARRFLLAAQGLWPPRQERGAEGVLAVVRRLGCIQFDPIDIVGRNPDLVLQARVRDYRPSMLNDLLYQRRALLDAWDKNASIVPREDWPFFAPRRAAFRQRYAAEDHVVARVGPAVRARIAAEGPLSSLDFKDSPTVRWEWGPAKSARAALEGLFRMGELGIHHRQGSRRYFDLIERLLPAELLRAPNPHPSREAYHDAHVLRRVGSLGLAAPNAGEHWLGIVDAKSPQRRAALERLTRRGQLLPVHVDGLPWTLYLRAADQPLLERTLTAPPPAPQVAFIAPLDNLLWNRKLIAALFDFEYRWEVYTPAAKRRYGYYTLPVLYGERFVARADFAFDKESRRLAVNGWWWEDAAPHEAGFQAALETALKDFAGYLGAEKTLHIC